MGSRRLLLAAATQLTMSLFDLAALDAHPVPSRSHLAQDVLMMEAKAALAEANRLPMSERIRIEADLADARYRLALSEGRSSHVALQSWRDFDARTAKMDRRFSIGALIALAEAQMRGAHAAGKDAAAQAALADLVATQQMRFERAQRVCISQEERAIARYVVLEAKVSLAAAARQDAELALHLEELAQWCDRRIETTQKLLQAGAASFADVVDAHTVAADCHAELDRVRRRLDKPAR